MFKWSNQEMINNSTPIRRQLAVVNSNNNFIDQSEIRQTVASIWLAKAYNISANQIPVANDKCINKLPDWSIQILF